jgi:hypothetical protein
MLAMLAQCQAGERPNHPLLVCAETHTAVDNMMARVLAGAAASSGAVSLSREDVLRIGAMDKVADELKR